jgi:hypothetical protein
VHRLSLSSSERFIPINRTSQEEEDSDPVLRSLTQRGDVFSEREEEEKDENDSQLDNKQGTQSDNDQDQLGRMNTLVLHFIQDISRRGTEEYGGRKDRLGESGIHSFVES